MVPGHLPAPTFMGRSAELVIFERVIADARTGVPSVVLVGGDAGIGKTTIVSESAARAGVALYLGRSTHIGGETIPLAPLADLLRQVRRSKPDLLTDTPALAQLQHWFAPGTVDPQRTDSSQGWLFVAVLELITHLGIDDVAIVGFEDLHWADTVTWDLFEYLARNLIDERVVLVGTYRANEVRGHPLQRARLAELSRVPAVNRIGLEGLERDEVAATVTALIGTSAPNALVYQVVARGQGNPFFTRELVTAHLGGEAIPVVLSDLISAEIASLDDRARHVLGVVATIGRETSHDLLAAIVGLPDDEVEAAVRTVIDARLLVVDSTSDAYDALAAETVSHRTRISIEVPTRVALDESSTHRLGLTPREAEVLTLVAVGRTNRQIGTELFVSDKTASVHVSNILRKLGVNSRVDAAAVAQRLGIT